MSGSFRSHICIRLRASTIIIHRFRTFQDLHGVNAHQTKRMKILIAYDGSEFVDAALDDLKNAGMPNTAEA